MLGWRARQLLALGLTELVLVTLPAACAVALRYPPPPPPPQPTASLARWRSRAGGPWCRPGPGGHAGPGGRRAMVVKQGIEVTSAGRGELNAAFGGLGQIAGVVIPPPPAWPPPPLS